MNTKLKENNWECDGCSSVNEALTTRCTFCGEPRYSSSALHFTSTEGRESIKKLYKSPENSNRHPANDRNTFSYSSRQDRTDIGHPILFKPSHLFGEKYSSSSSTLSNEFGVIVYIANLPPCIENDSDLNDLIHSRLEKASQITPITVQCCAKLGAGFLYVTDNSVKKRLIEDIKNLTLDLAEDTHIILFTGKLELVSYIVIDKLDEKIDVKFPKSSEIHSRWIEFYNPETFVSCDIVSIQFPNIYSIVSSSLDDTIAALSKPDFSIHNLSAHVYFGGYCSYLEDLPKSTTKEQLQQAICKSMRMENVLSSSLHIEINKQTSSACIITTDKTRLWSTKDILYLGPRLLPIKENLTCRLVLYPITEIHDKNDILREPIFEGKASIIEQRGKNLVLLISDKKVYDTCVTLGVLRLKDKAALKMEMRTIFTNPEDCDIDNDTWYRNEMIRYKPDIMQFIEDHDHPIFHYRWNSKIWLEQFTNSFSPSHMNYSIGVQHANLSPNDVRHLLQMTVMLNTIGTIRKKSYFVNNTKVKLILNPKLKTIVYNHQSLLEYGRSVVKSMRTPFTETKVKVVNNDCVVVYEDCCKNYRKPLLLNMANAIRPGGGYRKGDGAQEENLFRRSDYFRSLDIDLDCIQETIPERFYCSNDSRVLPLSDNKTMYPIDEYGAIYTSGLTFFRKSEDKGYKYMDQPLENVHALALAAYRNPKLDRNILSPRYAVGMRKKIENLFSIAYHHKHDCLILSALGCGAFRNPPEHVAKLFRSVIEQYAGFFHTIIFAVINDSNSGHLHNPQGNLKSFQDQLDGRTFQPILSWNFPNTIVGPYRILSNASKIGDVVIFDLQPCSFGAKCNELNDIKHNEKFSHPTLCKQRCLNGNCTQTNDSIHMSSFIHRDPCRYGVKCKDIDKTQHCQEYEHPSYCPNGSKCENTDDDHEKLFRHLPPCKYFQKCLYYQKHDESHCEKFRHYMPRCKYGSHCADFHDSNHIKDFKHPFPPPCPFTPYHCVQHDKYTLATHPTLLKNQIIQHCLNFAHVCSFGRNCTDKDPLHWEKCIHVPRRLCSFRNQCTKVVQEDHLNSFTHPDIRDIRFLCKHTDRCHDRKDPKHLAKYRHMISLEDSGVIRFYHLNHHINFVQNQLDNIRRVQSYIQKAKWEQLKFGSTLQNIIDWIRTVQPVHRCRPEILESIFLHGHVMSRDYMEKLKNPIFVTISILQHSRLRRIKCLAFKECAYHIKAYIKALVTVEFANYQSKQVRAGVIAAVAHQKPEEKAIRMKENILANFLSKEEFKTIRTTAIEIAQASIRLHSYPSGIGYEVDKDLGTYKNVFSILGPHLGHYYGDVFIVFKREVLHHPDANFSIQSATSYASNNCLKWRPWLSDRLLSFDESIKLFRRTTLHAAVLGYEYATALELIATICQDFNHNSMNIDLNTILKCWLARDSHQNIEAHLPQLIPLDYIDHIYVSQNLFNSLNAKTRQVIDTNFKNRITKTPHQIDLVTGGPVVAPLISKSRAEYQDFVIESITSKYGQHDIRSIARPIRGFIITLPSTNLSDQYVIPLTISQAYQQYKVDHPKASADNSVYIYWQAMNEDMMLTLSNEQIDIGKSQPNLRCLICYLAEKPSTNDLTYQENISYIYSGRPFQHEIVLKEQRYSAYSRSFYVGCNTDDFMTFCLEIQRSTGKVILTHSGPNSIYNHENICAQFSKSDLDLNTLECIHVSAGAHTVPIRNLFVTFEPQLDLHPTFDKEFKKFSSSSSIDAHKRVGSSLEPCPESIYCLIQFSDGGAIHNSKFSHPCRFAELCIHSESHLTHEPNQVPQCNADKACKNLCDPIHRAQYRHTGLSYFLIPCLDQGKCRNQTEQHRIKHFHGELIPKFKRSSHVTVSLSSQSEQPVYPPTRDRVPCRWGTQCHDTSSDHLSKYFHPSH